MSIAWAEVGLECGGELRAPVVDRRQPAKKEAQHGRLVYKCQALHQIAVLVQPLQTVNGVLNSMGRTLPFESGMFTVFFS